MTRPDLAGIPISFSLRLFGPLEVHLNGRPLSRLHSRKGYLLLALLALRQGAPVERTWLAGTLWPDSGEATALASLRNTLADLRRGLMTEAARLRSPTRHTLCLDLAGAEIDVVAFDVAIAQGGVPALERAVGLHRGPLLEGCEEAWAFQERQAREQAWLQALEELATHLLASGDTGAAEEYLRRAVAADPLRESAQRALMQALAASGNDAAALMTYRELRELLHRELNAQPDPETQALFRQLREQARDKAVLGARGHRAERGPVLGDGNGRPSGSRAAAVPVEHQGTRASWAGVCPPERESTEHLPQGTVTFLFTDIEGSIKLWEQYPEAMPHALARHDALLRHAIETCGGHVFKTVGDAFYAAFSTPPDAVAAALEAQRALGAAPWQETGPLRVRVALHTGVPQLRGEDYFGAPLNRAARLLEAGHGGQVLLSAATQELVRDHLPDGVSLRDLGEHRLRDLARSEHVFQLVHPGLPADFPPLDSLDALPSNLPLQVTSFVGREREIEEVKRILGSTRLLTLTGAGGTGKTRLALQVAADVLQQYPEGVWLVELAPLSDPALVPQTVATAVGAREEPGKAIVQALVDALKPKKLLLVLDNCEHLLSACAQVADALLRGCPNVQILATSREGLNIAGEQTYRVPSLTLPDPRKLPPLDRLQEFEAVRLFTDRAALGLPSFILTPANAARVAQVCRRLDGIPLAIELAAARVKALPVEKIAERLDDRFRLLTGGSRTALPRQQTLRALIDWSYDLLSDSERSLLRRLSVFTGGWTSEAAEAVCAGEGLEAWEVLDRLTALVEKSLVDYEAHSGEPRYRLLETVRLYSRDRLLEVEGSGAGRGRHRDHFLRLAEATEPHLPGPNPAPWLDRLEKEHDNLRAALAWSLEREEVAEGLRLAGALARFWDMRGPLAEGREWLAGTLSLAAAREPDAIRAKALFGAGLLAYSLGDFPAARVFWAESLAIRRHLGDQQGAAEVLDARADLASSWEQQEPATWALLEENLAAWRELGDPQGIAGALTHTGVGSAARGEDAARSLYEEALALHREMGNRRGEAGTLDELGLLAFKQGDCSSARALHEQSLKIRRELGDRWGIGSTLYFFGWVAFHNGDYETAQSLWEETLVIDREKMNHGGWVLIGLGRLAAVQGEYGAARARYEEFVTQNRRAGHEWPLALGLRALGDLACLEGHTAAAERLYEQSLILARELQDQRDIAWCLVGLADVRRAQEQSEQAARLLGAAEALWEAAGSSRWRPDHADFDRRAAAVRAQVDKQACAAAWEEGRAMTLDEAAAFALEDDVSSDEPA